MATVGRLVEGREIGEGIEGETPGADEPPAEVNEGTNSVVDASRAEDAILR